jgi:hypothetical protein
MSADQIHRASTFAPVNIAVIKYVTIDNPSIHLHPLTPPFTDTGASGIPNSTCLPTLPSQSPSPKMTSAPTPLPLAASALPKTPSPSMARIRTSPVPARKPASVSSASYERM